MGDNGTVAHIQQLTRVRDRTTRQRQRLYLDAVRKFGLVKHGCEAASCDRKLVKWWRDNTDGFADLEYGARMDAFEGVVLEIYRRGVVGVIKPVYQKGEQVGTIKEYSDHCLLRLAGYLNPQFRETATINIDARQLVKCVAVDRAAMWGDAKEVLVHEPSEGAGRPALEGGATVSDTDALGDEAREK